MRLRPVCPRCGDTDLRNSRTRLYDWPLFILGMRALRCTSCYCRFYRHRLTIPVDTRAHGSHRKSLRTTL